MVYKFFDKKSAVEVKHNEQVAEELHKPIIRNFKKCWFSWYAINKQF